MASSAILTAAGFIYALRRHLRNGNEHGIHGVLHEAARFETSTVATIATGVTKGQWWLKCAGIGFLFFIFIFFGEGTVSFFGTTSMFEVVAYSPFILFLFIGAVFLFTNSNGCDGASTVVVGLAARVPLHSNGV